MPGCLAGLIDMGFPAAVKVPQKHPETDDCEQSLPASVWSRDTENAFSPGRAPMPRPTAFT